MYKGKMCKYLYKAANFYLYWFIYLNLAFDTKVVNLYAQYEISWLTNIVFLLTNNIHKQISARKHVF